MKYKVGDYIKIKSWDYLVEEYGLNRRGDINTREDKTKKIGMQADFTINGASNMNVEMEDFLNKEFPDRVLKIKYICEERPYFFDGYFVEGDGRYKWGEEVIEGVVKGYKEPEPIHSRWEILDL